jgi:hypothetical protein
VSVRLSEILTLVGRLDDAAGLDTPRERFRRFLSEHVTTVESLRDLLQQSHERLGTQYARARQDLVLSIGRFLGFDVTFGSYDFHRGPARLSGHWRSRHAAHFAIDICSEQSEDADLEGFARTVATLDAAAGLDSDEHWIGFCLTTPFFAARSRLAEIARRCQPEVRVAAVESLLWLAEMCEAGRLTSDVTVRLLMTGDDCDFLVDVMRGLATAGAVSPPQDAAADPARTDEAGADFVWPTPDATESYTGFWVARMDADPSTPADQIFEAVVVRRQLLAVAAGEDAAALVRSGDRVCFLSAGIGVLGCAEVADAISDPSQVLRAGRRYSAVFSLRDVGVFEPPRRLTDGTIAARVEGPMPDDDGPGVALIAVSRIEFVAITGRMELVVGGAGPDEEPLRVRA